MTHFTRAANVVHTEPFRNDPGAWESSRRHAVRGGHVCNDETTCGCEPALVRERTTWGWFDWAVPADGSRPSRPHRVTITSPAAARERRLALRFMARRPARTVGVGSIVISLTTVLATVVSILSVGLAVAFGIPWSVALPAAALAPTLAEFLPDHIDDRLTAYVAQVEDPAACQYLQRLAGHQRDITLAVHGQGHYELRRATEIGHYELFKSACDLQIHHTREISADLIARERLMVQLARQTRRHATRYAADIHAR